MKSLKFNLSCLIQVGAFATLLLSSSVYANPYDGTWKVTTSCGPNVINKRPAFSIDDEIKITNGFIKYQWFYPFQEFTDITNWEGKISGKSMSIAAAGNRTNGESWTYTFEATSISPNKLAAIGALWSADKKKARDCTLDFTPVKIVTAGPSKADIKAERDQDKAWLAAEKQKLEAQQASIDSKSQAIEKKERQLREKEALLKKEKTAKDVAASKQVSNPAALSAASEKPKPVPVTSGF